MIGNRTSAEEIGPGYKIVKLKFNSESKSCHSIFFKKHTTRDKTFKQYGDRMLFVVGLPPYTTEDSTKKLFSIFGTVREVFFSSKTGSTPLEKNSSTFFKDHPDPKGFRHAHVIFERTEDLVNALSVEPDTELILDNEESPVIVGFKKWASQYAAKVVDIEEFKKEVSGYMEAHDKKVEEEEEKQKSVGEADSEGWTTVGKKGRKATISRKESVLNKIKNVEEKKRKKKQLLNFYTFQLRDQKMQRLATLREKFEEDKKKINLLKQSRKFKPF